MNYATMQPPSADCHHRISRQPLSLGHTSLGGHTTASDPDGHNIVLRSRGELRERAERELGDPFRIKALGISKSDWIVADLIRTMRNALAHRSLAAFTSLDEVLRRSDLIAPLKLTSTQRLDFRGIGRYLEQACRLNNKSELRSSIIDRLLACKFRT